MRIYIAAPWALKRQARALRFVLQGNQLTVIARWLNEPDTAQDSDAAARMDLDDIDGCDAVVLINPPEYEMSGTGGRHFETGYAYAKGKAVHVLGVRSNVFHRLADLQVHADFADLLAALERRAA